MAVSCSEWIRRLSAHDGPTGLTAAYGRDPRLLTARAAAVVEAVERFRVAFGDLAVRIYRAPARISLNPHSDHQGAWVPYGTHSRELIAVCAPDPDGAFEIVNVDPAFAFPLAFQVQEEINLARDAWAAGWLSYIEDPEVASRRQEQVEPIAAVSGHRATVNYVKAAALRLRRESEEQPHLGLRMALSGNIPPGGGLSSSSAVVVATACALVDLGGLAIPRRRLAELCGEAEWFVGTRGGSGDHAAMLLGHRAGLTHLCFRPPFEVRGILYSPFPNAYQLIVANSRRKADKGGRERHFFNRGVFAYRFAFLALRDALGEHAAEWGISPETVEGTTCLADLHAERLSLAVLYRLLLQVPENVTPRQLADAFPVAFEAAARGCFGTTDPEALPQEIPLRGAALYGLGRADRGLAMPALLAAGGSGMAEFGRLMSITHDGDRVTRWRDGRSEPYTENRERLADACLEELQAAAAAGPSHPGWAAARLRRQPGFYGASIPELDRMVDVAQALPVVRGAGLMGAGGGGYVLILAEAGEAAFQAVREALEAGYYLPLGLEPDVERWQPSDAAGALAL